MTKDLMLSYILPCYNTGPYIRQCIESLYKQGMDESTFEVIFVNNATEDNSEEIVFDIKNEHSNLVYIKLDKNICAGGAYNTGLKVARGKYVQFVDSDDYLKDNVMKGIIERMSRKNLEMLYFNIEVFYDSTILDHEDAIEYNGNFIEPIGCANGNDFLFKASEQMEINRIPVPAYRKMFLRDFLITNELYFTHTTIGCDYLHNVQCLMKAKKVETITGKVYMFRINPNGVTKSRQDSSKIIYALNNYSSSYRFVENCCSDNRIRSLVTLNLVSLINAYIGAMKYLDRKEKMDVVNNVNDIQLLKEKSRGFINKMLIRHPGFFLSSHSLFLGLRKIF